MPGIICPVVMYAPRAAITPSIATRPLSSSAMCIGSPSWLWFSISCIGGSFAKMFCLPYSVVVVIEFKGR